MQNENDMVDWNWISCNSSVIRDVGSILLGIIGIVLLWWRSRSADRQSQASHTQAGVAQEHISLARGDSLVNRYQKSSEMLSSETMTTRLGGMYALKRLAEDYPDQFHIQVMELLCAFVRNPVPLEGEVVHGSREDIQTALNIVVYRSDEGIELESASDSDPNRATRFRVDLHKADVKGAKIPSAKLRGAILDNVNLNNSCCNKADFSNAKMNGARLSFYASFLGAIFDGADMTSATMSEARFQEKASFKKTRLGFTLSDSNFEGADLTGAIFGDADLRNAVLDCADLSGARIGDWTRKNSCTVTQRQLDLAMANPNDPPSILQGTTDIETGKPIVWNHKLCGHRWLEYQKQLRSSR